MSQWAIITGGGGGIGAALTVQMSRSGYQVLAVDLTFECLDKLVGEKQGLERITRLQGDVSSEETLTQITSKIPPGDQIQFLAHFAAVFHVAKIQDVTRIQLEQSFSVNVLAPLLLIQRLLPRLTAGKARILHIDTLVDHYPEEGYVCYGVTKAAHYKMGQQLKLELAHTPIKVGSVYPGLVKTGGFYGNVEAMKKAGTYTKKFTDFMSAMEEKGGFLEPEESAKFLKYLLLEAGDEDFVGENWRGDDEKYWSQWRYK